MKYPWIDEYLMAKRGVTKDLQPDRYATCASCSQVPCQIWRDTRDPSMTDEQFEENIRERAAMLKSIGLT